MSTTLNVSARGDEDETATVNKDIVREAAGTENTTLLSLSLLQNTSLLWFLRMRMN